MIKCLFLTSILSISLFSVFFQFHINRMENDGILIKQKFRKMTRVSAEKIQSEFCSFP